MAGKILIADQIATNRIMLKAKLAGARYDVVLASNGQMALNLAIRERPELILIDQAQPDMSGVELVHHLKTDPLTSEIPVIFLHQPEDIANRLAALRAGADVCLPKPYDEVLLLARLRSLLRTRSTDAEMRLRESTFRDLGFAEGPATFAAPARIGLIAPTRVQAAAWKQALARHLPANYLTILERSEALSVATEAQSAFDALILAADLSRRDEGLRLMAELRARAGSKAAVICIAAEAEARETAVMALDLGADDVLPADMTARETTEDIALRLRRHLARKRRLDQSRKNLTEGLRLATIDPLTGLYNRRYAMPQLERIADHARRTGKDFAVMLLDLDRFKDINDTYGHAVGDSVLTEVAHRLSTVLDGNDLLARIGGEEFLIALPDCPPEEARLAADLLCRVINERPFHRANGPDLNVTISIGLVLGDERLRSIDHLFEAADHAMLLSKHNGRNQVQVFPCPSAA
ncbi:diguanylate cyclase [Thioclava sp. GXIMD4216]|uniref:diguanylate cyclase domain-containing protein n=1 Tax=unclassified Thioclava TaxID=2621713 RepID=UPI0030CFE1A1